MQDATVRAFRNSFLLAAGAAIVLMLAAVPLAYFIVWRRNPLLRALNLAAELPYALPGVVLAIACILVFLRPLPVLGLSIYGTVWIIFVAYMARFLTLSLRPVVSGLYTVDRALDEAARVSGARLMMRLATVVFPLVAPAAAAAGAILVFLTAFNELTVSVLLWSSGTETLGVVVHNLEESGSSVLAAAVAVITVAVIALLMLTAQAFPRRLPPGTLPWEL